MGEPEKVQKQGRDERSQEDYPTSAVHFCRFSHVVLFSNFIKSRRTYTVDLAIE